MAKIRMIRVNMVVWAGIG